MNYYFYVFYVDSKFWFSNIGETDSMAEIASCSYEARKFGIKNGMLLGQAFKLCPILKTIPYDFEGYKEVSYALYNHIAKYIFYFLLILVIVFTYDFDTTIHE